MPRRFERIAKMIFIRLQAANDAGDLNDLRAFTTPEMFAAVRLDLQERGPTAQRTDVVRVDAEVARCRQRSRSADRQRPLPRPDPRADRRRRRALRRDLAPGRSRRDGSREWAIAGIQQSNSALARGRLKLFIVTGASRGMGAALAEQLLADAGHTVLGIARRANEALVAVAARSGATLEQWQADLAEPIGVAARLHGWLAACDARLFTQATLVNNAGVVTTIGPLEDCSVEELSSALRVGLEAPLLLTRRLPARHRRGWRGERRVLNISSGLGRRAMAGQATYCAAKAGMDNLSRGRRARPGRLVANGAKIVSLAPGVIDTDMQVQLAQQQRQRLPEQQTFLKLKEAGQLASSHDAACPPPSPTWAAPISAPTRWPTFAIPDVVPRGRPLRLRHNPAAPATNSARSTRPETLHVTTRARRPRHGRAPRRLRADAAGPADARAPLPRPAPPAARIRRLGAAQRQARAPGHPADSGQRRPGRRATPTSAATASSTGIRAGARCSSPIARPAPARRRSIASRAPMGELEQLTDFAEPVSQASYEPRDRRLRSCSSAAPAATRRRRSTASTSPAKQVTVVSEPDMRHDAGRLAEPEQPADLFLGAAGSHRRRRAARRDRADADPGRPGEP